MPITCGEMSNAFTRTVGPGVVATPAPLPPDEDRRLDVLRGLQILDTDPEPAFDDLTALAAAICETPVAMISFVDAERQWFKSAFGVTERETPRDVAFCAHAILGPLDVFVVPDTHADPRFAGSPLVVGSPHVRGYAAAVLKVDGAALGTLCVIDREPLTLGAGQVDALRRLGRQVVAQLRLRETVSLLQADIAQRTRVERELAASERLHRGLVDNAVGLICTHEMDGTLRMVNTGALNLLGYSQADMVGHNLREFMPAERHAAFDQYLGTMQTTTHFSGELTAIARDGRRIAMAFQNFRFDAPEGPYVVGHGIDVTDLRSNERRLRHVVDNVREVIFETDTRGVWTYLNPSWTDVTGFSVQDSLNRPFSHFLTVTQLSNHYREFGPLLAGERDVCRYEIQCRTRHGEDRWLEVHARQVIGDGERIAGTTGTLRDVTDQRRLADQLVRAREEAEAASRLKSEFVANMSHEIRTPINGVVGLTSLLLDTRLTHEQREYGEGVMQSANALLRIVNDVLDLSKIEAGKLAIDPIAFELEPMVVGALGPGAVKADAKGLTIDTRLGPGLPAWVTGDPVRLRQVLINLVDNAVKFTERGAIVVQVDPTRSADGPPLVRFSVSDQGIGIPSDKQAAIFEKFTQADSSTTRKYGGTGLGLTICRQLVELMNGEIAVESTPGTGSRFHFAVPLPAAVPSAAILASKDPVAAVGPRTLHALVAEDNRINQTVAKRLLEKAGCLVDVAENGEVAVERARTRHYDVIFMDCQMPIMDGYEATRHIRSLPGLMTLPIVAMTAHAMEGDRERCLEAGMTDYLAKPLQHAELREVIQRVHVSRDAPPFLDEVLQDGDVIDETRVRSIFGDDVEAMVEMIDLVMADVPRYVTWLSGHVEQKDWVGVGRVAHTIRGSAGNVSAVAVTDCARAIEGMVARKAFDEASGHVSVLVDAVALLVQALEAWKKRLLRRPGVKDAA